MPVCGVDGRTDGSGMPGKIIRKPRQKIDQVWTWTDQGRRDARSRARAQCHKPMHALACAGGGVRSLISVRVPPETIELKDLRTITFGLAEGWRAGVLAAAVGENDEERARAHLILVPPRCPILFPVSSIVSGHHPFKSGKVLVIIR